MEPPRDQVPAHGAKNAHATAYQERIARTLVWIYVIATVATLFLTVRDAWVESRRHLAANSSAVDDRVLSVLQNAFIAVNIPVLGSFVTFLVMFALTWSLQRRKRAGLWGVIGFQVLGAAISMVFLGLTVDALISGTDLKAKDFFYVAMNLMSVAVAVIVVILCWTSRPAFPGKLKQGSWQAVLATLAIGVSSILILLTLVVLVVQPAESTVVAAVAAIFVASLGGYPQALWEVVPDGLLWLATPTSVMLVVVFAAVLYVFLRNTTAKNSWTAEREVAVRTLLLNNCDEDSLAYYATRRDKLIAFAPNGLAAIDYAVVGSVSLASGDPLGPKKHWPEAITAWKNEAREFGWTLAALGASEAGARAYQDAGLGVLSLGDEAVLEVDRFTTDTTSRTAVRRAAAKLGNAGFTVSVKRQDELPAAELDQIRQLANTWRHGAVERGFSMALGRVGDPADGRCVVVRAHDAAGVVVGLLTFVPWGRHGASLDVMRRSPEAPNGVTELMVTELMTSAGDFGLRHVSLNFVMFRSVFASAAQFAPPATSKVAASLLEFFDRFFQLKSLYTFSTRFNPSWTPRYLCYDSLLSLGNIAVSAGRAEGFLPSFSRSRSTAGQGKRLSEADIAAVTAAEKAAQPSVDDVVVARNDQTKARIRAVQAAHERGDCLYPVGLHAEGTVQQVLSAQPGAAVSVVARVKHIRHHGGVCFVVLTDRGQQVQVVLEESGVPPGEYRKMLADTSTGDLVCVTGVWGVSRSGEPSVLADSWRIAAKSLRPIPFQKFDDPATRLRQRSLDLIVNHEGAQLLEKRSLAVAAVRDVLRARGLLEVETPMLNTVHGGASARPFRTYINAYSTDLSLRIAPELYLKRLVVAGLGGVFEIGRNFRNEGADATHNPEFTAVEAYEPFGDYRTMLTLTTELIQAAAMAMHGRMVAPLPPAKGQAPEWTDISGEWPVVSVLTAVSEAIGTAVDLSTDFDVLLGLCRKYDIPVRDEMGPGALIEELYGELVEPDTMFPTFYIDFPVETSPLAGPHRSVPGLAERWDLVAAGTEIGTAYSELTDPLEQRQRLTEQSLKAAAGDVEAMQIDEDFLAALELGMPPCGGLGIGIDRLVMLLANTSIRPVLTFPFVKPQS